jgi:hypothetical protein
LPYSSGRISKKLNNLSKKTVDKMPYETFLPGTLDKFSISKVENFDSSSEAWLLGYWLAIGAYNPQFPFSIIFKTNKIKHAEKIEFALNKTNLKFSKDKKSYPLYVKHKYELSDQFDRLKFWNNILGSNINETNPKQIVINPSNALKMTHDELLAIWDGFNTAEAYKNNSTVYAESYNESVINFMQIVGIILGYRCKIKTIIPNGKNTSFFGHYKKNDRNLFRMRISKNHSIIRVTKDNFIKKDFEGQVYCITTSTGFFLGRTNGKVAVLGQCDALRYLVSNLFSVGGKTVMAEQKIGPMPGPQAEVYTQRKLDVQKNK